MQIAVSSARAIDPEEAASIDFSGEWVNEHGCHLTIRVDVDGNVKGTYSTPDGSLVADEKFDVCGFASADHISFVANLGKYGSLTSWAGHLTKENDRVALRTSWLLTKNINDEFEADRIWPSVLTGTNVFRPRRARRD